MRDDLFYIRIPCAQVFFKDVRPSLILDDTIPSEVALSFGQFLLSGLALMYLITGKSWTSTAHVRPSQIKALLIFRRLREPFDVADFAETGTLLSKR
jgi:hypothetical protein